MIKTYVNYFDIIDSGGAAKTYGRRKSKKIMTAMLAAAAVALLAAVAGAGAFFTSTDSGTNTFTIGEVRIELSEPSWDAGKATDLRQGQVLSKDPTVTNTGQNPAYVFMNVRVPKRDIYTYAEDKSRQDKAVTELVTLEGISPEWALAATDTSDDEYNDYVYVYGAAAECTSLSAGASTPALFTGIRYCNAVEGQGLDTEDFKLIIDAYGIQTQNISASDSKDPSNIWYTMLNSIVPPAENEP